MRRVGAIVGVLMVALPAGATWDRVGTPFRTAGRLPELGLQGDLRARGDLYYNLDLDRGPTPSGELLFPAPGADPVDGQLLTGADLRLRLRPYVLYKGVAVHAQVDVLDNLHFGSTPESVPTASAVTSQEIARLGVNSLTDQIAVRRLWGEAALPVGMISVGRQASHWGLGMLSNDGLCAECEGGDSADRVAFVTPLVGHLWGVGYDWSASGPVRLRNGLPIDREPRDDVRSVAASVLRYYAPEVIERKLRADKWVLNYGLFAAYRWQDLEAVNAAGEGGAAQPLLWIDRGFTGVVVDAWARLNWRGLRVEAEAAYMFADIANASLLPGVRLNQRSRSQQWGGALEAEWAPLDGDWRVGLDAGVASGDPAPGFGAREQVAFGQPGDLDGAQVRPPYDLAVDNFRFHPSYHVDRILWRQIVGTFTDGVYTRAHGSYRIWRELWVDLAAVGSGALHAESTPGRSNLLGVELDPTLRYRSPDGFELLVGYGFLFPLEGLSNPDTGRPARPGQTLRTMVRFVF